MAVSLQNIKRDRPILAPKIGLYGVGGIGKSTFASHAPDPVFLFTEPSEGFLNVSSFEFEKGDGKRDPVIPNWQTLMECVGVLYTEDHGYQTVVLDSIDFAEALLWKHVAKTHNQESIESFGYGKGYVLAADEARKLLYGLDALRDERGMAVVIIGHSDTVKVEPPDGPSYDRYQLRLHRRLAAIVHDWLDALLFTKYRTHVVKDEEGFGRERARVVDQGERVIYTQERGAWWAKNRYSLPFELPLSWQAFADAFAENARRGDAPHEQPLAEAAEQKPEKTETRKKK